MSRIEEHIVKAWAARLPAAGLLPSEPALRQQTGSRIRSAPEPWGAPTGCLPARCAVASVVQP